MRQSSHHGVIRLLCRPLRRVSFRQMIAMADAMVLIVCSHAAKHDAIMCRSEMTPKRIAVLRRAQMEPPAATYSS